MSDLLKKAEEVKSALGKLDLSANKELADILGAFTNLINDLVGEVEELKSELEEVSKAQEELSDKVCEIEESIEDAGFFEDEDVVAKINCPYCSAEVLIGPEFLTSEEPKIICESCKNEIEIITENCGCGCDEEDEDCECGCGCGEEEDDDEEDEGASSCGDCKAKH